MVHVLPDLPYDYSALEPHIDARTMQIHHGKHHQGYVNKLNAALKSQPDLQEKPLEELLSDLDSLPESVRTAVCNNGGGHFNHSLFWQIMSPKGGGEPDGDLATAIKRDFGAFSDLKDTFTKTASTRFGSGWGWLVVDQNKLAVTSTANQDTPLSQGQTPILGLDVWEHAYYLKYQNRRLDYIAAFWNVVNWDQVAKNYAQTK